MPTKIFPTTLALLASGSLFAHGPHVEVPGTGLLDTLLHLAAHVWPLIPVAIISYFLHRRLHTS